MTTTNDDSSSSLHRPDPAAVKAAKRNILVWLQLNDEERSRRRIADEIGVLFDALAARDEAGEALKTLERLAKRDGRVDMGWEGYRKTFYADATVKADDDGVPDVEVAKADTLPDAIAALARQLQQQQPAGSSKEEGPG